MNTLTRLLALLLTTLLTACSNSPVHLPRPEFRATVAALPPPDPATLQLLALNPTDAPLWLRRLDITLSTDDTPLAAGEWEGNRQIDAGTAALLDLSLPLLPNAPHPTADTPGSLLIHTRYARSGILGLLGGETNTYTIPITLHPTN